MSQFGIQMYTLRETMKTPEDYETTLRRVAEMGYTNVQLTPPAFSGAEDTQRLLEKYGLAADSELFPQLRLGKVLALPQGPDEAAGLGLIHGWFLRFSVR